MPFHVPQIFRIAPCCATEVFCFFVIIAFLSLRSLYKKDSYSRVENNCLYIFDICGACLMQYFNKSS